MARERHLARAPIQEALIEIRFKGSLANVEDLQAILTEYSASDWEVGELHTATATLAAAPGPGPLEVRDSTNVFEGVMGSSPDKSQFVQVRPGRIVFSKVRSYVDWSDLEDGTHTLFDRYVERMKPEAVTRIASRFINRIPPNLRFGGFDELLERPPLKLPHEALGGATIPRFLRRHVLEGLPGDFKATLTIGTVVPQAGEDTTRLNPFTIDIDVYKACELAPEFDGLRAEFAQIRKLKNALFFGSVTDAGVEQFA